MPIYPIDSNIEARIMCRTDSVIAENRVFFNVIANQALPTTLRDHIRGVWCTDMRGVMSNRGVYFGWKSRRIDPGQETPFVSEGFTDLQGGVTSNLGFEGECFLVVTKDAFWPDAKPGRIYTPFSYGGYLNGSMELATFARLDTLMVNLKAHFLTNGSPTFLRLLKKTVNAGGTHHRPVVAIEYRPWLAIQRRRAKRTFP